MARFALLAVSLALGVLLAGAVNDRRHIHIRRSDDLPDNVVTELAQGVFPDSLAKADASPAANDLANNNDGADYDVGELNGQPIPTTDAVKVVQPPPRLRSTSGEDEIDSAVHRTESDVSDFLRRTQLLPLHMIERDVAGFDHGDNYEGAAAKPDELEHAKQVRDNLAHILGVDPLNLKGKEQKTDNAQMGAAAAAADDAPNMQQGEFEPATPEFKAVGDSPKNGDISNVMTSDPEAVLKQQEERLNHPQQQQQQEQQQEQEQPAQQGDNDVESEPAAPMKPINDGGATPMQDDTMSNVDMPRFRSTDAAQGDDDLQMNSDPDAPKVIAAANTEPEVIAAADTTEADAPEAADSSTSPASSDTSTGADARFRSVRRPLNANADSSVPSQSNNAIDPNMETVPKYVDGQVSRQTDSGMQLLDSTLKDAEKQGKILRRLSSPSGGLGADGEQIFSFDEIRDMQDTFLGRHEAALKDQQTLDNSVAREAADVANLVHSLSKPIVSIVHRADTNYDD